MPNSARMWSASATALPPLGPGIAVVTLKANIPGHSYREGERYVCLDDAMAEPQHVP